MPWILAAISWMVTVTTIRLSSTRITVTDCVGIESGETLLKFMAVSIATVKQHDAKRLTGLSNDLGLFTVTSRQVPVKTARNSMTLTISALMLWTSGNFDSWTVSSRHWKQMMKTVT